MSFSFYAAGTDESRTGDCLLEDSTYDVVPDVNSDEDNERKGAEDASSPIAPTKEDEYDEPWEWSVGARLTSSLQVSPAQSLDEEDIASDPGEEDGMASRQQRRLVYETAFDSRVKRDADDLDRMMQTSPLFLKPNAANNPESSVARAASR